MSKIALKGNASGTGTFQIEAPNSNTDRTLVLPDEAGTVLTSGTDVANFPSGFANGITEADIFTLTSTTTAGSTAVAVDLTANLAQETHGSYSGIGTGMSESSGIFTFPATGIYLVEFLCSFYRSGNGERAIQAIIQASTDGGSNFTQVNSAFGGVTNMGAGNNFGQVITNTFIDVTNTTNVKVKFSFAVFTSTSTSLNVAKMKFIRLGDT